MAAIKASPSKLTVMELRFEWQWVDLATRIPADKRPLIPQTCTYQQSKHILPPLSLQQKRHHLEDLSHTLKLGVQNAGNEKGETVIPRCNKWQDQSGYRTQ